MLSVAHLLRMLELVGAAVLPIDPVVAPLPPVLPALLSLPQGFLHAPQSFPLPTNAALAAVPSDNWADTRVFTSTGRVGTRSRTVDMEIRLQSQSPDGTAACATFVGSRNDRGTYKKLCEEKVSATALVLMGSCSAQRHSALGR